MKPKFQYFLILSFVFAFSIPKANAQTLITFWDFNQTFPESGKGGDSLGTVFSYANSLTTDSSMRTNPLNANFTLITSSLAHIVYSRPQTHYSSGGEDSILDNGTPGSFLFDYSNSNDSSFVGGNMFIRARNPSDSCTFTMFIPTTGYKNITLDFALSASSSKAPNYLLFSYSTNGGTSWNKLTRAMDTLTVGSARTPDTLVVNNPVTDSSSWYPVHFDFSTDVSVNNNSNFMLQFMPAGPNSVGGSGNVRFDNFAVKGAVLSGINELSASTAGYNLYPNPTMDNVTINSERYIGMKTITIYDVVGQTVSVVQSESKQTIINTASLNAGVYFAEICEVSTGNKYTLKLIRN